MSSIATLLWASNLFCDTLGHLAFKSAAIAAEGATGFARWRRMLGEKWIWIGIGAFVAEFFLWLAFLSVAPLSVAVLVGSLDILTIMIGGRLLFEEAITPRRALAVSLIGAGVALVGWG